MSAASRNLLWLLGASVAIILSVAALNFIIDPLQLFRPARLTPAAYSPDTRTPNVSEFKHMGGIQAMGKYILAGTSNFDCGVTTFGTARPANRC